MRTTRAAAVLAATLASTIVATATAFVLAGPASAATARQTYLQANICGNACNGGGLPVVANLAAAIRRGGPFAVTLNEVCQNQYDWLVAHLRPYHGRFDPTGPTCRNGARYGNAILVRTPAVDALGTWPLPSPAGGETRHLMCLRAHPAASPALVVCGTHISYVSENIAPQVYAVATILHRLAHTEPVLLGGDFNADPSDPRLDSLYSACHGAGVGDFQEADAAGCVNRSSTNSSVGEDVLNEGTLRRHKFDYLFLSSGPWATAQAQARDSVHGLSDHVALWATTTRRI